MKLKLFAGALAVLTLAGCCRVESAGARENEFSLDGKWRFRLLADEKTAPADEFWQKGFDVSGWDLIDVPSCWEMKGFGKPLYDEKRFQRPQKGGFTADRGRCRWTDLYMAERRKG